MTPADSSDLADLVGAQLPYLRRYARALTGSQQTGDAYAAAALEALAEDPDILGDLGEARLGLFRVFHSIWSSAGAQVATDETGLLATVQDRMENLTRGAREALLLNTIEQMPVESVAVVMNRPVDEVAHLLEVARREMDAAVAGRVMIIEDEAIIAMDLEAIIRDIGHEVAAVARTASEAVAKGRDAQPDLVLADIHLADDSSGIDAVNTLLQDRSDLPVIFVTAYPERLLTGTRPEPAFLISKPYDAEQVRSAVHQALFFASTTTLAV